MQTELAGEIITLTFDVAVFAMLRATYTLLALSLRSITFTANVNLYHVFKKFLQTRRFFVVIPHKSKYM